MQRPPFVMQSFSMTVENFSRYCYCFHRVYRCKRHTYRVVFRACQWNRRPRQRFFACFCNLHYWLAWLSTEPHLAYCYFADTFFLMTFECTWGQKLQPGSVLSELERVSYLDTAELEDLATSNLRQMQDAVKAKISELDAWTKDFQELMREWNEFLQLLEADWRRVVEHYTNFIILAA